MRQCALLINLTTIRGAVFGLLVAVWDQVVVSEMNRAALLLIPGSAHSALSQEWELIGLSCIRRNAVFKAQRWQVSLHVFHDWTEAHRGRWGKTCAATIYAGGPAGRLAVCDLLGFSFNTTVARENSTKNSPQVGSSTRPEGKRC